MDTLPQKSILLVEDEAITAMMNTQALQKYGYIVSTVNSGEKAVDFINNNTTIDLILMDIDLGKGIDGTQAAEQILSKHDIPVVFLSSHTEPEVVEKTEKITSYGYVVKNSSVTVLDASIKMAFKLFDAKQSEKQKERILQQSNDKFKLLFTSMTEGFALHEIILDEQGKPVDYRFLDVNPAFETLTGLRAVEILNKTVLSVLPKTEATWIEKYGKVAITGEAIKFESYAINLNKFFQVVAFSPEKLRFATIFNDVTEQKIIRNELINEKKELENKESLLQTILSSLEDVVVSRDKENKVTFFNNAFNQVTKKLFDKPAFIGMNTLESLPLEDNNYWTNILALVLKGEKHSKEYMFPSGENQNNYYRTSHVPIITGNEIIGSLEITQDITKQKQTEDKLQQSQESYRAIVENTPDYIMRYDENHKHTYGNTMCLQANGLTLEEFVGKTHRELGFPENLCLLWEKSLDEVFKSGIAKTIDFEVELNTGLHYLELLLSPEFDISGKVNSVIGISRDITGRKRAEFELSKNKSLLYETEKCGRIGGWEFNVETLEQTWTDEIFYILEIDLDNGAPVVPEGLSYIEPKYREEATKAIQRAIDYGEPYDQEWEVITPKGKIKWVHAIGRSNQVKGKTKTLSGSFQDITDRKLAEIKIINLLSEKELLLKEVHHRIKNNMDTIYGLLILQSETIADQDAITALQDAGNRVQSMKFLYDKLYRSANFTELSIKEYIVPLIDEIISHFPNNSIIRIEKNIEDIILLTTQLQPLGIILNELLTNIMKYAFIGKSSGKIIVSATLKDNIVTLTIADNGNGMPDSVSFENTTGFGLVLVKGLTEQLCGTIWIERGQGTKIVLEFRR